MATYDDWRNMPVTSQNIGGPLDFGTAPSFSAGGYEQAFNNALSLNQQNYNNILKGYQGLQTDVLDSLQGVGAAESQNIADRYTQESGRQAQNLISRGLGNTTVANAIQSGIARDKSKADIALSSQMANLIAGYKSSLGGKQLDWMNTVSAPYPDANLYLQLARMQAAANARNARPEAVPLAPQFGAGLPSPSSVHGWRPNMTPLGRPAAPRGQSAYPAKRTTLPPRAQGLVPGSPEHTRLLQNYQTEQNRNLMGDVFGGAAAGFGNGEDEYQFNNPWPQEWGLMEGDGGNYVEDSSQVWYEDLYAPNEGSLYGSGWYGGSGGDYVDDSSQFWYEDNENWQDTGNYVEDSSQVWYEDNENWY